MMLFYRNTWTSAKSANKLSKKTPFGRKKMMSIMPTVSPVLNVGLCCMESFSTSRMRSFAKIALQ